jgi:hypothetical protein
MKAPNFTKMGGLFNCMPRLSMRDTVRTITEIKTKFQTLICLQQNKVTFYYNVQFTSLFLKVINILRQKQQSAFTAQHKFQEAETQARYFSVACNIATYNTLLMDTVSVKLFAQKRKQHLSIW